jgi:hypothetical protein
MYYMIMFLSVSFSPSVSAQGGEIAILEGYNRRGGKEVPSGDSVRVGDAQPDASKQNVRLPHTSSCGLQSHVLSTRGIQVGM